MPNPFAAESQPSEFVTMRQNEILRAKMTIAVLASITMDCLRPTPAPFTFSGGGRQTFE
jgi:hypothetical protein